MSSQYPESAVVCTSVNGSQVTLPRSRLILRPSAYAVIRHDGKVAVVTNRLSGRYYFPGGGTEPGERITDGLKREVWEEAGDDGEGNPQWVAIENLKPADFHNHGSLLLSVLQSTSVPQ